MTSLKTELNSIIEKLSNYDDRDSTRALLEGINEAIVSIENILIDIE